MEEEFTERSLLRDEIHKHFSKKEDSYIKLAVLAGILSVILVTLSTNIAEVIRQWAVKIYYTFIVQ